ncbi:response regulator transcription factor [Metapseudomonas resinovorans]|uniref:response regulator transcription factor n=1 Tax=Metapseudomonas resinovorans TaxID=53412 RepID=UPI0009870E88|nr:response regulator [Pseudomonas resinovorans]
MAVIAVVDDDESIRTALESLLRSSGYQARTYSDALEFLDSSGPAEVHCLISDIQMPGMCGVELHEKLIAMGFRIPTIFITAYPGAIGSDTSGLVACLPKPFEADKLLNCIETALRERP